MEQQAPDEVDFSSGFDKEYEPINREPRKIPHRDPRTLWYRDLTTVLVVAFLCAVLITGSVLLTTLVFSVSPWKVAGLTVLFFVMAAVVITLEVCSIHVR